jgi:DNA-binding NtrC family response regulator
MNNTPETLRDNNGGKMTGDAPRIMTSPHSNRTRILVADDQPDIREALRLLLKGEGFDVETVASPAAVLSALEAREFDGLLMDLNYARDTTSGQEGLDLLSNIRSKDSTLPIIVMTAWGSLELAVEAMRRGAKDFIQKPWENARLLAILKTQIELSQALRKGQRLEAENRLLRADGRPTLIAESAVMRPVLDLIARVGPSDANVLITGEHGTGKEVIARTLYALSSRAGRPLVTVNAGGLPEGVFESELFGHVKGAFTDAKTDRVGRFELADGGTLFLDEIGELTQAVQVKLLRVIERREFERVGSNRVVEVDIRLVAATNRDLEREVSEGRFREDLYYRLAVVPLHLPPLRERREDIPVLAVHFAAKAAEKHERPTPELDPALLEALQECDWPGNVRELENLVERLVVLTKGARLGVEFLPEKMLRAPHASCAAPAAAAADETTLEGATIAMRRRMVVGALQAEGGNRVAAARRLGISRSYLHRLISELGITGV